jgi:hypothetical protein
LVDVAGTKYALDAASAEKARAFTQGRIGKTPAKMEYVKTGKTGTVTCGWGSTQSYPEISVLSLAAK